MKVMVLGKEHMSGTSKKTGKPYDSNVVELSRKAHTQVGGKSCEIGSVGISRVSTMTLTPIRLEKLRSYFFISFWIYSKKALIKSRRADWQADFSSACAKNGMNPDGFTSIFGHDDGRRCRQDARRYLFRGFLTHDIRSRNSRSLTRSSSRTLSNPHCFRHCLVAISLHFLTALFLHFYIAVDNMK